MTRIVTGQLDAVIEVGSRMVDEVPGMREEFERVGSGKILNNSPYDLAAPWLCLREAGGVISDGWGRPLDRRPLLGAGHEFQMSSISAANADLHSVLISAVEAGIAAPAIPSRLSLRLSSAWRTPVRAPHTAMLQPVSRRQQASLGLREHRRARAHRRDLVNAPSQLAGKRILHVSATAFGGGVSEILYTLVPLMRDVGLDCEWHVIYGREEFFNATKVMHNALQGNPQDLSEAEWDIWQRYNEINAQQLAGDWDICIVHDPQPAAVASLVGERARHWIWRCHIDLSHAESAHAVAAAALSRPLRGERYSTSRPTCRPASTAGHTACRRRSIRWPPRTWPSPPMTRSTSASSSGSTSSVPLLCQVSRFDPWKDPLGVIDAYRIVKEQMPEVQLALVGSMATDDPEGWDFFNATVAHADGDPDIHILNNLNNVGAIEVNAFQSHCDVAIQKSTREGFGLTVTEAIWKARPFIGGDVGGIPLQISDGETGFLVSTPCSNVPSGRWRSSATPGLGRQLGRAGKESARRRFLSPAAVARLAGALRRSLTRRLSQAQYAACHRGERPPWSWSPTVGPVTFQPGGEIKRGTGGLVTALIGLASYRPVTWIASAMTDEDVEQAERNDGRPFPVKSPDGDEYRVKLVASDADAYDGFYNIIANPLLWFIQHYLWDLSNAPDIRRNETEAFEFGYNAVNEDLANGRCSRRSRTSRSRWSWSTTTTSTPCPGLIRRERPDAFLHHFVHIPWSQSDSWRVLPSMIRKEIYEGILSNDIIGFHTRSYRRNFLQCCEDLMDLEVDFDGRGGQVEDARYGCAPIHCRSIPARSRRSRAARGSGNSRASSCAAAAIT